MKARIGGREITVRGGVVETHRPQKPTFTTATGDVVHARHLRGGPVAGTALSASFAGSNPAPAPQYDSKWEERYAKQLDTLKLAGEIVRWWYHPFSMWLPGKVRYSPDFMVQHHGHLQIVEVKGWSKNLRDGMTRLKVASGVFTCYQWSLAKWNGQGFDITDVNGDKP